MKPNKQMVYDNVSLFQVWDMISFLFPSDGEY